MFAYEEADIYYAVTFGKGDGSSNIDYSVDLNKNDARIYTKARMLGQDLDEIMDTGRIERKIIRYERYEYGTDISNATCSIWFRHNGEQPPIEDVKEYLKDLLASHRIASAREVIEAQINVFNDIDNDWNKIALDLALEVDCPGYAKRYQDGKFNEEAWNKEREKLLKTLSEQKPVKQNKGETASKSIYVNNPWVEKPPKPEPEGEEKERRHRGCRDITKPDDKQLHIVTKDGREVVIDAVPPFRLNFYGDGLCAFNTENLAFFGCKDGCYGGKWGFFNTEGEIVIEPEYYFACGPYGSFDNEYYLVARILYGNFAWGVLDSHGKESLPCLPYKYAELQQTMYGSKYFDVLIYAPSHEAFDIHGRHYGLIKRDGTVILEPQFYYISSHNFNWDHKLFIAGMDHSGHGVFSLEKNKFITPENCDYIKFHDETKTIECHYPLDGVFFSYEPHYHYEAIFDYDGNLISKIKVEE